MMRALTAMATIAAALAALAGAMPVVAGEQEFPLRGTYVRGKECKGDGTDRKSAIVSIAPDKIETMYGPCVIDQHKQDGSRIVAQTTCTTRKGDQLKSEVVLILLEDGKVDVEDKERGYKGILFKCPDGAATQ